MTAFWSKLQQTLPKALAGSRRGRTPRRGRCGMRCSSARASSPARPRRSRWRRRARRAWRRWRPSRAAGHRGGRRAASSARGSPGRRRATPARWGSLRPGRALEGADELVVGQRLVDEPRPGGVDEDRARDAALGDERAEERPAAEASPGTCTIGIIQPCSIASSTAPAPRASATWSPVFVGGEPYARTGTRRCPARRSSLHSKPPVARTTARQRLSGSHRVVSCAAVTPSSGSVSSAATRAPRTSVTPAARQRRATRRRARAPR